MMRGSGPRPSGSAERQLFWLAAALALGLFGANGAAADDRLVARGDEAAPADLVLPPAAAPHLLIPNDDTGPTGEIRLRPPGSNVAAPYLPPPAGIDRPQPAGPTVPPPLARPSRPPPPTQEAAAPVVPSLIPPPSVPMPVGSPPDPQDAPAMRPPAMAPVPAALTPPVAAAPRTRLPAERPTDLAGPSDERRPLATAGLTKPPPLPPTVKELIALPPGDGEIMHVEFSPGSSALSEAARARLRALAHEMRQSDGRLQLEAFAAQDNVGKARRTSLSRALTVRSFLIEQGLSGTRVDVRALGIARDGGSEDRVDVILRSR